MSALDADRLSIAEYHALLTGWNDAHKRDDDEVKPPTAEEWEREQERIAADHRLTNERPA